MNLTIIYSVLSLFMREVRSAPHNGFYLRDRGCIQVYRACTTRIITRVTKTYQGTFLALGTTQICSYFTNHWTKFLTHLTGNNPWHVSFQNRLESTFVEMFVVTRVTKSYPLALGTSQISYYFTKLPVCIFATKILRGNQPFDDDVTDVNDISPATCFFCTYIDM